MDPTPEILRVPPSVADGVRASASFDDLRIVLHDLHSPIDALLARRPPDDRPARAPGDGPQYSEAECRAVAAYAEDLAKAVFGDPGIDDAKTLISFATALRDAQRRSARLRVWLVCPDVSAAEVPWELMRLSDTQHARCCDVGANIEEEARYLALHPDLAFLRTLASDAVTEADSPLEEWTGSHVSHEGRSIADRSHPDAAAQRPLKVLIAMAETHEPGAGEISSAAIQRVAVERILSEEAPGLFAALPVVVDASPESLEGAIREYEPDVVQLICHGARGDIDGDKNLTFRLFMHNSPTRAVDYPVTRFADVCGECGVKIVVLSTCWSGQAYPLIKKVPIVIGMQFRLSDLYAADVIERLFDALVHGFPFEFAVHWSRAAFDNPTLQGHPFEFAVPVVYSRSKHTTLLHKRQVGADPFTGLIRYYRRGFVGREWAIREIRQEYLEPVKQCAEPPSRRICLVTARGGWGKSALMAQLVSQGSGIAARMFYRYGENQEPLSCVLRLLTVMAQRYPEVWARVERETEPSSDPYFDACDRLRLMISDASVGPLVIVIDGLDECSDLARALPFSGRWLPDGVAVVASARPEWYEDWKRHVEGRQVEPLFHIDLESAQFAADSTKDLRDYARMQLIARHLSADDSNSRAEELAAVYAGRFLELSVVLASLGAQTNNTTVSALVAQVKAAAGTGSSLLAEAWTFYWNRATARVSFVELGRMCETVMHVLAMAKGWASEQQLADLSEASPPEGGSAEVDAVFRARSALQPFRRFLATDIFADTLEVRVRVVHESLRSFFIERFATLRKKPADWAGYCSRWKGMEGYARWYALRFFPEHLLDTAPDRQQPSGVALAGPEVECRAGELADLLFQYDFMSSTIGAVPPRWLNPPMKPVELLRYFENAVYYTDSEETKEALRMVGNCLSQAVDILDEAPEELPSQLYGRLGNPDLEGEAFGH